MKEFSVNEKLSELEQDEVFDYLLTNYSSNFKNIKELKEFIDISYKNNSDQSLDFIIQNLNLFIKQMRSN